jgi:hypothetical protein
MFLKVCTGKDFVSKFSSVGASMYQVLILRPGDILLPPKIQRDNVLTMK